MLLYYIFWKNYRAFFGNLENIKYKGSYCKNVSLPNNQNKQLNNVSFIDYAFVFFLKVKLCAESPEY